MIYTPTALSSRIQRLYCSTCSDFGAWNNWTWLFCEIWCRPARVVLGYVIHVFVLHILILRSCIYSKYDTVSIKYCNIKRSTCRKYSRVENRMFCVVYYCVRLKEPTTDASLFIKSERIECSCNIINSTEC